jgi:Zn finger protein HypA/HybF involved in hydrogenase expression
VSPDQLRDIAIRFEAKRLEAKQLFLTCQHCKEYFLATTWERYCINCRGVGRAT